MLTIKQHSLLKFIDEYIARKGVSPSFEEMKKAVRLQSKSGVHRLILALEERGFLRRLPNRARALEVLKVPTNIDAPKPRLIQKPRIGLGDGGSRIPLLGKIAAGLPIEAIAQSAHHIDVPPSLLGRGQHYALTVDGDSMIEEGIFDGDLAIIEQADRAENGAIVVALVRDEEATLKKLRRKGDMIELIPANARFKTQTYPAEDVKIQGTLKGLLRRY